jgi:hypothetical protein
MSNFEDLPPKLQKAIVHGEDASVAEKKYREAAAKKGGQSNANRVALNQAIEAAELREEAIDFQYRELLAKEGEEVADEWLRQQGLYK